MHTAPCGDPGLQQPQQQQGKRGEQWVPVQEQQSSSRLFHEARRIFANAVAGRTTAASSTESLPAAPPWTGGSPVAPAAAGSFFAVDSAVTAALAPADAGAGTGLGAARNCSNSMESSPVVETPACDTTTPLAKRKPPQAAAVPVQQAPAAGPVSRGETKGKAAGCPPVESRANLMKRSGSIITKNKEAPRPGADSAKAVGTKKKDSPVASPECRRQGREGGGFSTTVSSHTKAKDAAAACSSKALERSFKKKGSSSRLAELPRAGSGFLARKPTTGETIDNHVKKHPQQQQKQPQEKQPQEKQPQEKQPQENPLQEKQPQGNPLQEKPPQETQLQKAQLQEKQPQEKQPQEKQFQEKQQQKRQVLHGEMQEQQKQHQKQEEGQQQNQQQKDDKQRPQKSLHQRKQPQQPKERQQRCIRPWGDRTEERKILEAFPDFMGAELLSELPSFLQLKMPQQGQVKQKETQDQDAADEGFCLFRLWGPHVEKCWVQVRCGAAVAAAGQEHGRAQGQEMPGEETETLLFEMLSEGEEKWGTVLRGVQHGTPYEFVLQSSWNDCFAAEGYHLHRRDPYARQVDFDSTTCFVVDPFSFRWRSAAPAPVTWNRLIIYELHPGTFVNYEKEGKTVFEKLVDKLDYIQEMHFNAVELLPVQEFGGAWGYNPRLLMAPHGKYGTPQQLQQLVDECHRRGLAVIFDVVLNHGSSKLNSLWNWDGYGKDNNGGIYFEGGGDTGWGRKFAFQKQQVRQMVLHAAARFIEEYKADGLRVDSVHNMPWDFLREMTWILHEKYSKQILIAEITPENPKVCDGGAGFDSCWVHATYYDAVKITRGEDSAHHMDMLRAMIDIHKGFLKSHQCINSILGSHDQAGNKQQGLTDGKSGRYAVNLYGGRNNWHSRAQCRMWYSLQTTSRGLPMLFMGTETCQDDWWNVDPSHSFNWQLIEKGDVFCQQMRSLVTAANKLRLNNASLTNDDTSVHFPHVDSHNRVLGVLEAAAGFGQHVTYRRIPFSVSDGFTRGVILVVLNFSENQWDEASYEVNTDWRQSGFVQLFNSQAEEFGGWDGSWTAKNNEKLHSSAAGKLAVKLPKWSVTVYEKQE